MFKMTDIKLELMTDMFQFIEKGIPFLTDMEKQTNT